MANVDPLAALTAEEMAELLRKRNADKAAMGAAYSGVDAFADIPKTRPSLVPGTGARFSEPRGFQPGTVTPVT